MSEPTTNRFGQLVRRLFSIKGGYQHGVIEDVMPVVPVVLPFEIDRLHLAGVHLFSVGNTRAAAALTRSLITLTARPNSIAVVKRLFLGGGAAGPKTWRLVYIQTQVTPAPQIFPQQLDARAIPLVVGAAPQPANVVVQESDTAAALPGPMIAQISANGPGGMQIVDLDLVLFGGAADPKSTSIPSWQLQLWSETVNEPSMYTILGYTRFIEPSEQF